MYVNAFMNVERNIFATRSFFGVLIFAWKDWIMGLLGAIVFATASLTAWLIKMTCLKGS